MRYRTVRSVVIIAACAAWGGAVAGIVVARDADKSYLIRALADACACLREDRLGA